jgi:hypothetical protein
MLLRVLLAVVLALASVASAAAQCHVGVSFERAVQDTSHHAAMGHHEPGDGAQSAPRACDTMVQTSAPQAPNVAPALVSIGLVATLAAVPELVPPRLAAWRADRPPDRSRSFKDIFAKTHRLLV